MLTSGCRAASGDREDKDKETCVAANTKQCSFNTGLSKELTSDNQFLFFDITVGEGGRTRGDSGQATTVRFAEQEELVQISGQLLSAPGGKGAGGSSGYKEPLPNLCQLNLTHGQRGFGPFNYLGLQIDEKCAGGGFIVNGQWDGLGLSLDGKGYGAGGGSHAYAKEQRGFQLINLCLQ